ncbi:MAG: sensor histidine kinase [Aristaeellaceae bacterium]
MARRRFSRRLLTLRRQLLMLMCVAVACICAILLWSNYSYTSTQKENLENYQALYSAQLAQSVRQSYVSYRNIAYSVAYNNAVQDYVELTDAAQRYDAYQQIYNLLNNTIALNANLMDIAVISPEGNSISLCTSPQVYERYTGVIRTSSYAFQSQGTLRVAGADCHILSIPIHRLSVTGQNRYLGTVFLAINNNRFFNTDAAPDASPYAGVTPDILLTDEYGSLIYGRDELFSQLPEGLQTGDGQADVQIQGTRYFIRVYSVTDSGSRLYILFDVAHDLRASQMVSLRLSASILVILVLMLVCFIATCFPVSSSLQRLTGIMQQISEGGQRSLPLYTDPGGQRYSCSEISDIFHFFSDMLQELEHQNQVIIDNYTKMMDLELNNRQTEIAFLRSQINPHFLYNTLTVICGMSADGQNDEVIEVTGALANIFRYSIQGSDMVTLTEEMAIVDAYLKIQSHRFEDRFRVRFALEEDTLDFRIPKMIIQPLVENAIVHGLEPSLRPGEVTIATVLEEDELVIDIRDTGVGMSAGRLAAIREGLSESTDHRSSNAPDHLRAMDDKHHEGIGILNVNSRIVLYYGKEYAMTIDSREGEGTGIRIRIPTAPPRRG